MAGKSKIKKPSTGRDDSFESVAQRLECDEDKRRFEAKLGKLAKAKSGSATRKSDA